MDGSLIGTIRYHKTKEESGGLDTCLTFSRDGGMTWTAPERMHIMGYPPHLLRHSSGAIVLTYGYREKKYGQRARVSWDEGKTWSDPIILRDDGETTLDLGIPARLNSGTAASIPYTIRRCPENKTPASCGPNGTYQKENESMAIKLSFGKPRIVAQGPTYEEAGWGTYQFPSISRMDDGRVVLSYHVVPDTTEAYRLERNWAVSSDDGSSWSEVSAEELPRIKACAGTRLPDGKRLRAVVPSRCPSARAPCRA